MYILAASSHIKLKNIWFCEVILNWVITVSGILSLRNYRDILKYWQWYLHGKTGWDLDQLWLLLVSLCPIVTHKWRLCVKSSCKIETKSVQLFFTQAWVYASSVADPPVLILLTGQECSQTDLKFHNHLIVVSVSCGYPANFYICKLVDRLHNFIAVSYNWAHSEMLRRGRGRRWVPRIGAKKEIEFPRDMPLCWNALWWCNLAKKVYAAIFLTFIPICTGLHAVISKSI